MDTYNIVIIIKSKLRERGGSSITVASIDLKTGESLKKFFMDMNTLGHN